MMRPIGSSRPDSPPSQVWITSSNTGPTSPIVCQRSPSGCRSGFDAWSGSSNTSAAVSNDKPCFERFAAALSESHVQRITQLCSYKYGVTNGYRQGLLKVGRPLWPPYFYVSLCNGRRWPLASHGIEGPHR